MIRTSCPAAAKEAVRAQVGHEAPIAQESGICAAGHSNAQAAVMTAPLVTGDEEVVVQADAGEPEGSRFDAVWP